MAEAKPRHRWLGVVTCVAAIGLGGGIARLTSAQDDPAWIAAVTQRVAAFEPLTRMLETHLLVPPLAKPPPIGSGVVARAERPTEPPAFVSTEPDRQLKLSDPGASHLADGLVMTGVTPHRMILFTFDDGPDPRTTPLLLDHLDHYGIKAVFFLTGGRLVGPTPRQKEQAEIAREIVRRGHVIGNHTYTHPQLPLLSHEDAEREIVRSAEAIERATGTRPYLLRPPGGSRSARIDRLITSHGYTQMIWNIGTGDFQVREASEVVRIFKRVLDRRPEEDGGQGGIVLMHDTHPWTVEAFPLIVEELRRRNCKLLARGEELFDIVDDPSLFFQKRTDEDASTTTGSITLAEDVLELRQTDLRKRTKDHCRVLAAR